jgi:assimilatory nitrate reductase catalytic subunit
MQHIAEPFVEVCPADAVRFSCATASWRDQLAARRDGGKSAISDGSGKAGVCPDALERRFARQGKVNALVEGRCDPVSGQPEKQTAVRILPWQPAWQGALCPRMAGNALFGLLVA